MIGAKVLLVFPLFCLRPFILQVIEQWSDAFAVRRQHCRARLGVRAPHRWEATTQDGESGRCWLG